MNFLERLVRMLGFLSDEQKEVDVKTKISNLEKRLDDNEADISLLADRMNNGYDSFAGTHNLYTLVRERKEILTALDELKEDAQ